MKCLRFARRFKLVVDRGCHFVGGGAGGPVRWHAGRRCEGEELVQQKDGTIIHTFDAVVLQEAGQVDQSAGMLDDDVREKGYALLCVSTPQSDCKIRTIEEVQRSSGMPF